MDHFNVIEIDKWESLKSMLDSVSNAGKYEVLDRISIPSTHITVLNSLHLYMSNQKSLDPFVGLYTAVSWPALGEWEFPFCGHIELPKSGKSSLKCIFRKCIFRKFCKFLAGSFSAVSKRNFARKYAFDSIFQALQDLHPFAPLQSQNFRKKSVWKISDFRENQSKHFANVAKSAKFCQNLISKFSVR